jgi:hypothetical protein
MWMDQTRATGHAGRRRRVAAGTLVLCCGILALATPAAAGPRPDYADGRAGTFLPYLNAPARGDDIDRSPRLGLSFGGEPRPVLMDTGSTGIVVSASRIPEVDALPAKPGRITYSSSGRIMIGRWVTTPVTIWGRNGARVTTAPIPVLAVDRIDCTGRARRCTPEDAPGHVAMMGVGFGREYDGQSRGTPETNPLLNLATGDRPVHRGYVVTREGVHVGLTAANTHGDFRFAKLDPHPSIPGEWQGVPACISVSGRAPACGRGLLDTGVTAMFVTLPGDAAGDAVADGGTALLPGTRLSLSFPESSAPGASTAAAYDVVVGDQNAPMAPDKVFLNTTRPAPFVNTGLHVLEGFDLLYDAEGGYYGFRRRRGSE